IFLETLETDGCQVAIRSWVPKAGLPWFGFQQQPDGVIGCSSGKRRMASKQMVKHRAQSVHVCCAGESRACGITQRLFWGHVTWCAQRVERARNGPLSFHQPRQAEIRKVRFTFGIDQNVSGLYVS